MITPEFAFEVLKEFINLKIKVINKERGRI